MALDILGGQIQAIHTVLNPDKLTHVGPVADAWAVLRETTQARRDHKADRSGQVVTGPEPAVRVWVAVSPASVVLRRKSASSSSCCSS